VNASDFFTQAIAANPEAGKATFNDDPLPEGMYPLVVESCELRKYVDGIKRKPEDIATACGADPSLVPGSEVAITFTVTEGKYAKRKLFGSYCIQASSNQKSYGEFTPEKKVSAGNNDLCGLMIRLGKPNEWSDWVGKLFNGYVTAKKGKDGKVRNDLRCTVKPGEENAPKPSAPQNTTPHGTDEPPF
jgi:hypothetical protein